MHLLTLPVLSKRGIEMARKFNNNNQWQMQENPPLPGALRYGFENNHSSSSYKKAKTSFPEASASVNFTSSAMNSDTIRRAPAHCLVEVFWVFYFYFIFKNALTHSQVIEDDGARSMLSVQKGRNVQKHFKNANKSVWLTESTILISANSTCLVLIIPLRFS